MFSRWKRIRKPAYELTIADLEQFPLWESCLDEEGKPGQDESTMRPYRANGPIAFPDFYGLVATDFTTPAGRAFVGVIEPKESFGEVWEDSPQIWLDQPAGRLVSHPLLDRYNQIMTADRAAIGLTLARPEHLPDAEVLQYAALVYRALGLSRDEFFPLTATPRAPIKGYPQSWTIGGFLRPPGPDGRSTVLK